MSYVLESDFVNTNVMQNKMIAINTNAIALHSDQLVKMGDDMTFFGNTELPALQAVDQNLYDNINFNINRLNEMQDQLNQAKTHRDTLEAKIDNRPPPHECAFWDIPCKMKETTSQIGLIAILAGAGFVGYKVLTR